MDNQELAAVFTKIADLMDIKGENIYKILAYRRVADNLRISAEEAMVLHAEDKLSSIPGVGKAIAEKIAELLDTGRLEFLDRLEEEVPPTLLELLEVPDLGPKKAALFWKQAGITNLSELEAAAREGRLRSLPGMGEKSEQRIVDGIHALRRRSNRMMLGVARPIGLRWLSWLRGLPGVQQAEFAGSLRRWRSTIGDLDLVAASTKPAAVMQAFVSHPEVHRVLAQGESKSSIELSNGLNIQLWIQPPDAFGSLLQFVTGSKDHNVRLRELAQRKGLSLSERGITDQNDHLQLFASEDEIYAALGLPWIPPELREDRGEIQAALAGKLPVLPVLSDITAELHSHSTWSDGAFSIADMVQAARQRGLKMLAITDHTSSLGITNGLTVERLRAQRKEIDTLQAKIGRELTILQGAEVEIKADGSLDFPDEVLAELDVVIASLHVSLRQPREIITARLIKAMHNPHVDIIGHLSGRLLPNREGADLDMEAVLAAAKETNVCLEINANPSRLDLDEIYSRRAADEGILLSINTDAHTQSDLDLLEYGISVARRAWVPPASILNARAPAEIRAWLASRAA